MSVLNGQALQFERGQLPYRHDAAPFGQRDHYTVDILALRNFFRVGDVEEIAERENIDRVVISLAERRGVMPIRQLTALKLQGLPIEDAHSLYERLTGRIMLENLRPSSLILSEGFHKSRLLPAAKRGVDIAVSLVLIALTLPLMLATALLILIESGRPALFR